MQKQRSQALSTSRLGLLSTLTRHEIRFLFQRSVDKKHLMRTLLVLVWTGPEHPTVAIRVHREQSRISCAIPTGRPIASSMSIPAGSAEKVPQ